MNPGEFDFGDYLQRQNIYLSFRALHEVPAMIIAQNQGNPLVAVALAGRQRILASLQVGLQDDMEVAQTMQGMILGARAETSPALKSSSAIPEQSIFSPPAVCRSASLPDSPGVDCGICGYLDDRLPWQWFPWPSLIVPSPVSIRLPSGPR